MKILSMATLAFGLCWLFLWVLYWLVGKRFDVRRAAVLGFAFGPIYYVSYLFLCDLVFGTGFSVCLFLGVLK